MPSSVQLCGTGTVTWWSDAGLKAPKLSLAAANALRLHARPPVRGNREPMGQPPSPLAALAMSLDRRSPPLQPLQRRKTGGATALGIAARRMSALMLMANASDRPATSASPAYARDDRQMPASPLAERTVTFASTI